MELYPWQAEYLRSHGRAPKWALWASPRLGKTLAAIETLKLHRPRRVVVLCPLVVAPQWEAELESHGFEVHALYQGGVAYRKRRLESAEGVVVMNDDVLAYCESDLIRWKPDFLIVDEAHRHKSPSAKRAKAMRRLAWRTPGVRLLTGTPAPNHLGDVWGQLSALDPDTWGRSYERFAREYLIRHPMFPSKIIGYRNEDKLQALMLRYASIVRREDVFGPDTWQVVTRVVHLPPKARRAYDDLAIGWATEVGDGGTVNADHVLKRLTRLQQLAAGYLPTEEGNIVDVHRAKVDAVLADLDEVFESGEKAVLFHRFRWEGERYHDAISTVPHWRISGDTGPTERADAVRQFANLKGPGIVVAQLQAGGVGISFATGTHGLFTTRGFSFSDDVQARDRIYAPGARRVLTYYEADRTVDQYISRVLDRKEDVHQAVRNADWREIAFGRRRE